MDNVLHILIFIVPEKPKIPLKPSKHKTSCVTQPKDEDSDKSETNENTNTTNAVQKTSDVTEDVEDAKPDKKLDEKPTKSIPEPNQQHVKASKGKKLKQAKVNSVTKTTWFVDSGGESKDSDTERVTDTETVTVDDKPPPVEHSCSVSSTTPMSVTTPMSSTAPMSPTRENTDYENVPDNSSIYGNVEIIRNQAGRNDITSDVREREWSPLLDVNIPRARSSDVLESVATSENIYEDVDVQDDNEFRRRSLRVRHMYSHQQGFMQDQIFASHTCFGGHVDINC